MIKKTVVFTGYTCNNKCIFCCNENKRGAYEDKKTDELKRNILEARRRGSSYLEIIGGEPTLRKDIVEIVSFAKSCGFKTIMFSTNGRMFSYDSFAKKIVKSGLNHTVFSIHGHTEELHDHITGVRGSFKQLIIGVKNVEKLNQEIGSNTTIIKQNYKFLPEIGNFIFNLGIRNAEFIFVDPTHGAPRNNFDEIVPKISHVAPYLHECLKIGKKTRHWDARYFPICYLKGYEKQISELKEVKNFITEHIAPDFINPNVEFSRRMVSREKPPKCRSCIHYNICEGLWKEYIKNYGSEELRPELANPM
jgi:MoaA/NifB/PqqE/SkfB family radical SAM enzyme